MRPAGDDLSDIFCIYLFLEHASTLEVVKLGLQCCNCCSSFGIVPCCSPQLSRLNSRSAFSSSTCACSNCFFTRLHRLDRLAFALQRQLQRIQLLLRLAISCSTRVRRSRLAASVSFLSVPVRPATDEYGDPAHRSRSGYYPVRPGDGWRLHPPDRSLCLARNGR